MLIYLSDLQFQQWSEENRKSKKTLKIISIFWIDCHFRPWSEDQKWKIVLIFYNWHGQSSALQTFLRPFSIKYMIPHSQYFKENLTFKAKIWHFWRTFKEPIEIFTNLQRYFQNNLESLYPPRYLSHVWNELTAPRAIKITENGPWLKKSGLPCSIISDFRSSEIRPSDPHSFHYNDVSLGLLRMHNEAGG
jgi:hypothetical protein